MECIEKLVNEIYNNCKIPFQLIINDVGEFSTPQFKLVQNNLEKYFSYNNTKCCIRANTTLGVTIDLLKFCIEEKLSDVYLNKNSIVSLLLSGEKVDNKIIRLTWPIIEKDFNLINIYMENYSEELLLFIKQPYLNTDIEILFYNGNIIMIGKFEDILEHVQSIRATIESIISGKFYISYCKVDNYLDLKKCYENTCYKINLAIKYNIIENIFDSNKLILEGIIDSVSDEMKKDIYEKFKKGISKLDNEMIRTIEVFFKYGLNLSEAAKELYIHRNTLIYRLDKIQKYTNYDIRNFNEAVLLKIILFIWKEKK
ncbi:helix-turn-helix domain-containing protein [uncultured Clostridium sp.]|uniref:PucR family transcriptional regulator n=1 Tax=uncultured Clostridium sp. TaxID=59620 RepID=UPI002613E2FA|nr:helix-turn-helix domain-containing protein [uncultured Clostridium sp.]